MRMATQITPFWRGTGGHAGDQVGTHIDYLRSRATAAVVTLRVCPNERHSVR
jgi:hypothetical protein